MYDVGALDERLGALKLEVPISLVPQKIVIDLKNVMPCRETINF